MKTDLSELFLEKFTDQYATFHEEADQGFYTEPGIERDHAKVLIEIAFLEGQLEILQWIQNNLNLSDKWKEIKQIETDIKQRLKVIAQDCGLKDYKPNIKEFNLPVSGQLPLSEKKCGKCEMLGDAAPCDECYRRSGNFR